MKRFTKTMAALGLAAVMGTGSAFISLADVTTSVNPVATSRKSGWVDVQNHWYYFDENGKSITLCAAPAAGCCALPEHGSLYTDASRVFPGL